MIDNVPNDSEWVYSKPQAIYKCWNGSYIDLERIVSISEINKDARNPNGMFGFYIYFQLKEKPIRIPVDVYEYHINGSNDPEYASKAAMNKASLERGIKQRESIVNAWKKYKESNNDNSM